MGVWALLLVPLAAASHISEVAVNVDELSGKRHSNFVPLVAFKCGFRNKYMSDEGEWVSDANRYATCQTGKLDILKYCKRAYPTLNITNLVEYSHEVSVEKWCREEGTPCKWTHTIRPYRCIVGEFHSEALQVPKGCKFSHVNGRDQCNDYNHWKEVAMQQCNAKGTTMSVRSFAMLEPCGLDLFTGVEFVCCPSNGEPLIEVKPVTQAAKKEEDDDEYDDDDDSVSLESDEDDETEKKEQDPYFKTIDPINEHENFKKASERLEKKHRDKISKVMKEWSELEGRYKKMAQKDAKGAEAFKAEMTNRFQKTVASLEEENKQAKQEIETVHEQRVQEALNEKKRQATHDYRQALALHVGSANKHNVLKTLKSYIRSEEKDRIHMLNRYRHLMRTDLAEAKKFKPQLLHRLRYFDLRINGTLAMLRDFPDLETQVRPIALAFWSDLRKENTPEITDDEINKLNSLFNEETKVYVENKEAKKTTTTETPKKDEKTKVLPDDTRDSEEDDDEYYEDEDDEEVRKIKKVPIKAEEQKVELKPKPISVEVDEEKKDEPKKKDAAVQTDKEDKEDEDEDSDESDSDEDDEKDAIKELRVDIEPIIEESALRDLHASPAFYRHDKLVQSEADSELSSMGALSSTQMGVLIGAAVLCTLLLAFVVNNRRRRAHAGFIEVDVCTPEERHLSGMQVTGYENPTYSFFDAKP